MAKTKIDTEKAEPVYHASLVTADQKKSGITYTYDWAKVTDKDHLEARNKELASAPAPVTAPEGQTPATV